MNRWALLRRPFGRSPETGPFVGATIKSAIALFIVAARVPSFCVKSREAKRESDATHVPLNGEGRGEGCGGSLDPGCPESESRPRGRGLGWGRWRAHRNHTR